MAWKALPRPGAARHTSRVSPVAASASRIDHGRALRSGVKGSCAPSLGTRMNARAVPSGDHVGLPSRSRLGSR